MEIKDQKVNTIMVAPLWPCHPWFLALQEMVTSPFLVLPSFPDTLHQGPLWHLELEWLQTSAWRLNGTTSFTWDILRV